ncbi:MAG: hypothetical protein VXZ40_05190 [Nanoarchaeota archaeon]|nr:hypothetical protein [Nanoarchaeota archaeon]
MNQMSLEKNPLIEDEIMYFGGIGFHVPRYNERHINTVNAIYRQLSENVYYIDREKFISGARERLSTISNSEVIIYGHHNENLFLGLLESSKNKSRLFSSDKGLTLRMGNLADVRKEGIDADRLFELAKKLF